MKICKLMAATLTLVLIVLTFTGCANSGDTPSSSGNTVSSNEGESSTLPQSSDAESKDSSTDVKIMKFGMSVSADQYYSKACQEFASLVEERTNGAIQFEFYFSGALGSDREIQEALLVNAVQFLVTGPAIASYNAPEWAFPDQPGLFPTRESVYVFWDSDVAKELLDTMSKGGVKGITYLEGGMYCISNNKGVDVKELSDLQGMKVRAMENDIQITAWNSIDMQPTIMAWGDIYLGLQQGVLDAVECSMGSFYSEKFYEVQKNICISNRTFQQTWVGMSEIAWNECTSEEQEIIMDAAEEIKWKLYDDYGKLEQEYIKSLENDYGVTVSTLAEGEWEQFAALGTGAYEATRKINPEFYDRYMDAVNNAVATYETSFQELYAEKTTK